MTVSVLRAEPPAQRPAPSEPAPTGPGPAGFGQGESGTIVLLSPETVPPGAEVIGVLVRLPGAGTAAGLDGAARRAGGDGRFAAQGVARVAEPGGSVREIRPGLVVDENARLVHSHGEPRSLTRLEFDLLVHFARRPGRVLTRDSLLVAVWDRDPAWSSARTVDVHVLRLRRALGSVHSGALQTVRGVGYRWVP